MGWPFVDPPLRLGKRADLTVEAAGASIGTRVLLRSEGKGGGVRAEEMHGRYQSSEGVVAVSSSDAVVRKEERLGHVHRVKAVGALRGN